MNTAPAESRPAFAAPQPRPRRALLWTALVVLLLVAQTLLVALSVEYESSRQQERAEAAVATVASAVRQAVSRDIQRLQALLWNEGTGQSWTAEATELLRQRRPVLHIERRRADLSLSQSVESPERPPLFSVLARDDIDLETDLACTGSRRLMVATFSRSYFVPQPEGLGMEVIDLCFPIQRAGKVIGFMAASFGLSALLDEAMAVELSGTHELSFVEGDGSRLARSGTQRGAGVYVAERLVDLPGLTLSLRADSVAGRPQLIPNLTTALVLGLSLGLFVVVVLLDRDVRRRSEAETALAEALAFRRAMEDSMVTGLRARDLDGRLTYANRAFCHMVGCTLEELTGHRIAPYWPPELADEYAQRQALRLTARPEPQASHEGFETVYMRKDGERIPVRVYEAPLVDGNGQHSGWMSTVLDLSAQRRVEELARAQQERLQASARLATVGEMASLLSHELNQPLAAIASYAAGSLNLLEEPTPIGPAAESIPSMMRQALQRIAEQAERAGRVIKSVHGFVRRRDGERAAVRADELVEAVMPLVRLQARKSGTRIELDLPSPAPRVVCDRTMVEQVLLNLTRNAIQAMETGTLLQRRLLTLRVRRGHEHWVTFSVIDRGIGIPGDVAQRLFTPFFTTRHEGMGLGLSLCRTVIEQHGGALDFTSQPVRGREDGDGHVTEFRFTLPAEAIAARAAISE